MRILAILLLSLPALARARDSRTFAVAAHEKDRRYVLAEIALPAGVKGPLVVKDKETGKVLPSQEDGTTLRVLIGSIPAGAKKSLVVESFEGDRAPGMILKDDPGGWISVQSGGREITRYYTGAPAQKHKKPFLYPLNAHGVNVLREWPIGEGRQGEAKDHPHHSGLYHAFGEVNGKEYWSKTPITPKKVLKKEAGPACARIVAENAWGEDLVETHDILVLNAGEDAVLAANGPVVFGKNLKMAKEGSFAVRVAAGLSLAKGDAPEMMSDSKGNKGEKAIRADSAPWVDYTGEVDGKRVGISVMNHPSSFRYPTTWHVRAYGLFAANPWIVKGESTLAKGESLLLKYRVYVHEGNATVGKVAEVFEGYCAAKASAE